MIQAVPNPFVDAPRVHVLKTPIGDIEIVNKSISTRVTINPDKKLQIIVEDIGFGNGGEIVVLPK